MSHKTYAFVGTLLLAGASVLLMPGLSQAQHGGGGHGGGHGGGGHFSGGAAHFGGGAAHFSGGAAHFAGRGGVGHFNNRGAHFGAGGAHFRAGDFGRFHAGAFRGAERFRDFHHGFGRFGSYYGGYGYYPYYGLDGGYNYPYYDGTSGYDTSVPGYDWSYSGSYGQVAPDLGYTADSAPVPAGEYQSLYPSLTTAVEPGTAAHLTVKVPVDAQLTFNGTPTTAIGMLRQFDTPPLAAGKFTYNVQARWTENGHEVTQTQQVEVTAGARVVVDFPTQPTKAGTVPNG